MSHIEERVIRKIRKRAAAGLKKYGVTVARDDLSFEQWMTHAQEEALDFAIYLQRLIYEMEKSKKARNEKPKARPR